MDRQKTRERSELCMLRGACRRGTHTFKQTTLKERKEPPTHTQDRKTNTTHTATRQLKTRGKRETRNATNRTDDDRRAAKATAEAKKEREESQKRTNKTRKILNRPPGPLQTTQGQDQRKDLDPGVGMQGARGSKPTDRKGGICKKTLEPNRYIRQSNQL